MQEEASSRPTVVVVDDDLALRSSLKFALELEGFSVRTYADASALLDDGLPAAGCLVIDQKLPGMSGFELLRHLRVRQVSLPIILITTHPTRALLAQAAMAGVRVIEKPLLTNALTDGIREAMLGGKS